VDGRRAAKRRALSPAAAATHGLALVLCLLAAACTAPSGPTPSPGLTAAPPSSGAPSSTFQPATSEPAPSATSVVLVGGGRIGRCRLSIDEETAAIVEQIEGIVITLGDHAYPNGTADEFERCYDPTWGRFRERTYPVPGNHDYRTAGAAPYFAYFGQRAGTPGEGWYTYQAGAWRVYALNSECPEVGGCESGSPQYEWLKGDLEEHPAECVLAYWHRPVFSSGSDGGQPWMLPVLALLYEYGADLLLTADDHLYERLAQTDPSGSPDPTRGVRQINVGTAGSRLDPYGGPPLEITEVRDNTTNGVLKLELYPGHYSWEFLPVRPDGFSDSGSDSCH
jgi:acid phosphatase type 7